MVETIGYRIVSCQARRLPRPVPASTTLIGQEGSFYVHVVAVFPLGQAAEVHRRLQEHFLGKLALTP